MGAGELSSHRQAINGFVARHELAWDLTMALLALIYIVAGLFEDHPHGFLNVATVTPVEIFITFLFAAEFSLRFYAAESRLTYLKRHWIDLLALLPAIRYLRFLRLGRLLYLLQAARFLRLGVMVRLLAEGDRAATRVRWIAARNGVHVILIAALGLVLVGGSLVWEIEHTSNRSFQSLGDAIWWAFATMTTVGYGSGPMTLLGRVVGGTIMITGIACFGLITATVTAYFVERSRGHQASPNELLTVLEDIQRRLTLVEQEVRHGGQSTFHREQAVPGGSNRD